MKCLIRSGGTPPFLALLAAILVAAPIGTHAADADSTDEVVKALRKLGATQIDRDEQAPGKPVLLVDFFGTRNADAAAKELGKLKDLLTVHLWNTDVTDAGLKHLAGLSHLQTLHLVKSPVTDAGLKELAALKELQTLDVGGTGVTETGAKELKELLPKCKVLR